MWAQLKKPQTQENSMKVIGVITVVVGIGLALAVGTGVVNFKADANLTQKGKEQVKQLRTQAAEAVRAAGDKVADAVK
jgi:hypothetical protein